MSFNSPTPSDAQFERYRKDRLQRRARYGGPRMRHDPALQEIEEYESHQMHDQQLAREVSDFFDDATRTAATIVEKVTENIEVETAERLRREMQEFLADTLRRAQAFMIGVHGRQSAGQLQEVDVDVRNMGGEVLDEFRAEGTAQLDDKHYGQDPFAAELDEAAKAAAAAPAETGAADQTESDFDLGGSSGPLDPDQHLAAVADDEGDTADEAPAARAAAPAPRPRDDLADLDWDAGEALNGARTLLLQRVFADPDTLKRALKVLVQSRVLSRAEATKIYRDELAPLP